MRTGSDETGGAAASPKAGKTPKTKRNWLRWTIFGVCVFVAVLAVVLSVVPKYAARSVMETELAKIGIKTTGSETLYVNLWRGEVRLGPVEFWSEGAERGQIGTVGAKLSLVTLFQKRALIETFIIEEVDLIVDKRESGIFVNGVSLQQFMTAEDEPVEEVEEEVEEDKQAGWGAGIDNFDFRNSRLILKNFVEGDELEIEIEHLLVTLFHTWAPDEPGVVSLRGTLAGAPLFLDATARPFADDIKFRFEAGIENFEIARAMDYGRIAVFFEEGLFTRRDGMGSTTLSFSGFLFEDGRIEMNGEQKAVFEGLHLVMSDGVSVQLDSATLSVRSAESYVPDGRIEVAGEFTSTVEGLRFETKQGQMVRLDSVLTNADNFYLEMNPDKSIHAAAPHISRVKGLHVKPDANTAIDLAAAGFAIEKLAFDQSPEGKMNVSSVIKINMEQLAAQSGPDTRATVQTASIDSGEVAFEQAADGPIRVSLNPKLNFATTRLQGPAAGSVDQITVALSPLVAEMAGSSVSVQTSGSTSIASVKLTTPGAEGQPGADVSVDALRVELQNLVTNMAGGDTRVNGAVDTEISGVAASVPQPGGAMTLAAEQVRTAFPTLNAEMSGGATTVNLAGTASLAGFETSLPSVDGRPEIVVGLSSLELALKEIAASLAGDAPQWMVAADVAVKEVGTELKTPDSASTVNIGSVDVIGIQTDQNLAIVLDEIVVTGLDADLVDTELKAFGGGGEQNEAPGAATDDNAGADGGAAPTVRLGRLAVGDQSVVTFTDTSVDPPMVMTIGLDDVEIKSIDTGDPATRTDIAIDTTINKSSKLAVTGWATPLKPTPDFKLSVNLKALPLPVYSSYVSDAVGWNLDGGDLSTTVNATADGNALNGQVDVTVENLFLNPVTAADAEKLEKQIGVPLQFAVGIMKDEQGRIDLDLPVSGTLGKPEVDYSSAIRKAVSGFLGSIFGGDSFQGSGGFEFQAVTFAPGAAVMDEAGKQVADKYIVMLEKKSTLKLGVCGRATVEDYAALFGGAGAPAAGAPARATPASTPAAPAPAPPPAAAPRPTPPASLSSTQAKALVELATERTNAVRSYLVDEKGIDTARIVQCRTTYDLKDPEPPRAQFAM